MDPGWGHVEASNPTRRVSWPFSMSLRERQRRSAPRASLPAAGAPLRDPDLHGRPARPGQVRGAERSDAHVIRNAGGRASDDAIRSLVISYKLLGTQEWFVVHHTNCGMEFFDSTQMGELYAQSLDTAELGPDGFGMSAPDPAPRKAATSTGSRSPTPSRASSTTSLGSARTRSSRPGSRSTATSTTSRPAASTRSPARPRPAEQHDPIPRGWRRPWSTATREAASRPRTLPCRRPARRRGPTGTNRGRAGSPGRHARSSPSRGGARHRRA